MCAIGFVTPKDKLEWLFGDLQVIVYVLLAERTFILGLLFVVRNLGRILRNRRFVMGKKRAKKRDLAHWFRDNPVAHQV